jgi:hypothetical protein
MRRFLTFVARQTNGLNVLLAILLVLLVDATILPLCRTGAEFAMPSPIGGPSVEVGQTHLADVDHADYARLVQENFFHPERKFPIPAKKEKQEVITTRPEIVLYGTYITSDLRLAFVEEKGSPVFSTGRGQKHTTVRLGERVAGFELKQIEPDKIVLVKEKESITIFLRTKKPRLDGDVARKSAVGISSPHITGTQPASGQKSGAGQLGFETQRPIAPPSATPLSQPLSAPVASPATTPLSR